MSSKNSKDLRKQLRNVVQETLPEVLSNELVAGGLEQLEKRLRADFGARLEAINDSIMSQLKAMDERSKDVQHFIMNQVQAELARNAPKVDLNQAPTDSTTLVSNE